MMLNEVQKKMVDQKVDHWLARLLDLSGGNRLLNFKETKTTTLTVQVPAPEELFTRLVEKGSTLSFPMALNDPLPLLDDPEDEKNELPVKHAYRDNEIGSDCTPAVMTRKLYNLLSRSKTAREEQGVNILFISFGFLKWRDSQRGEWARSPVLLVPVELRREAPGEPYQLAMPSSWLICPMTWMPPASGIIGLTFQRLLPVRMIGRSILGPPSMCSAIKNRSLWPI
jgi:hypothetical protein